MACPLCKSEQRKKFAQLESFGYPLVYYVCQNCGLIYQSPEESIASDPGFYEETYRKIYQTNVDPTKKDLWVQEQRAKHQVQLLNKLEWKPKPRILDIGASSGWLLQSLKTAFNGWVVGVEPGDAYRAYAEAQGIEMYPSIEALIERKSPKFDLVSMMHVLEHLPDPVATLRQIRENLLDPYGVLLIEVPNFYAHDSYELAHLTCFTPNTLEQTLSQAGYRVHTLLKHGEPRSSILKLYITVLARPLMSDQKVTPITKEPWIGIKRKTGIYFRRVVQKLAPNLAWYPLPGEEEL